jgi:hypothetical protein
MTKVLGDCAVVCFGLLFLIACIVGFMPHGRGGESMAIVQAHAAVRPTLYNPDAADFKEPNVQPVGTSDAYRVSGVLYSTNGYGGTVPATYEVVVDFSGEGHDAEYGRITFLKVNDTVYR